MASSGSNSCFTVSKLASSFQSGLPFLTDLDVSQSSYSLVSGSLSDSNDLNLLVDHYLRSLVWGVFVILAAIVLVSIVAVHFCCIHGCWFAKKNEEPETKKFKVLKRGCCSFSAIVLIICLGVIGAGLWAEVVLNGALNNHITVDHETTERIRHWLIIAMLVLAALFILLTLLATISALLTPKAISCYNIMIKSLSVIVVLSALIVGPGFSFMIFTSDLCNDLSELQETNCSPEFTSSWMTFCNEAFMYAFILFVLGCSLIVCLPVGQCFGAVFVGALSSVARDNRIRDSNQPRLVGFREDHQPTAPTQSTLGTFYANPSAQRPLSHHGNLNESHQDDNMTAPLIPNQGNDAGTSSGAGQDQPPTYNQAAGAPKEETNL